LFYMAPEQAHLQAVPAVRWDVYALGALLYCMLTGAPPYRSDSAVTEFETAADLEERLSRYRQLILTSPRPAKHREIRGVDRELADIIDGCLAPNRHDRYANVQEVLDALNAREARRTRRPLVLLGFAAPALLLAVVSVFAWSWFDTVMTESDVALRRRALDSNSFAAKYVAKAVTNELEIYYRAVEEMASSFRFQTMLETTTNNPEIVILRQQLNDPALAEPTREQLRATLVGHPARRDLQNRVEALLQDPNEPNVATWFVTDPLGLQLARAPAEDTVGKNYGWRSYFHGREEDYPESWRPKPDDHIKATNISAVFYSQINDRWTVTISTPVLTEEAEGQEPKFLGIIGLSVDVHRFMQMEDKKRQFAVLVDWRAGPNKGLILQHPLFDKFLEEQNNVPDRFQDYRLHEDDLPDTPAKEENYVDPLGKDPEGQAYDKRWLAKRQSVSIRDGQTGWIVIVQESYEGAIGHTLDRLKRSLLTSSLVASALIAALLALLWERVIRASGEPARAALRPAMAGEEPPQ